MTRISEIKLDSLHGVKIENEFISVSFLPEVGGKIISLILKETGREFISREPGRSFRKPNYGDNFEDYDMSGFDECFPAIAPGDYPEYPWKGVNIPDHGELWTLPWKCHLSKNNVLLSVNGVRFPYRFEKKISLDKNYLRLNYKLVNLVQYDFKYIWSAHPLFTINPGALIMLPEDIKVRIDWSKNDRLGTLLTEHPWPETRDKDNQKIDLSKIISREADFADKFFTTKLKQGWCALYDPASGEYAAFTFSPEEIPYVGVWLNQGGWPLEGGPSFNAALEPCTGCPDRLDIAIQRGEYGVIDPGREKHWTLNLAAGKSKKFSPDDLRK